MLITTSILCSIQAISRSLQHVLCLSPVAGHLSTVSGSYLEGDPVVPGDEQRQYVLAIKNAD
jgi:hypothetical protein